MKPALDLGPDFEYASVGIRFVMNLSSMDLRSGSTDGTKRIVITAQYGESQHANDRVSSKDLPADEAEQVLADTGQKFNEFGQDPFVQTTIEAMRDLARGPETNW